MWRRLISDEPVFAVLNMTLRSSTLIESCLTAKSCSANRALFIRGTKALFCHSAWFGMFTRGPSSISGLNKLFRQHDTFHKRLSDNRQRSVVSFQRGRSRGNEATADWQLCDETLWRSSTSHTHHTHSHCRRPHGSFFFFFFIMWLFVNHLPDKVVCVCVYVCVCVCVCAVVFLFSTCWGPTVN